jgi:hypothetical protein
MRVDSCAVELGGATVELGGATVELGGATVELDARLGGIVDGIVDGVVASEPRTAPTGTVVPGLTSSDSTTPSCRASISRADFAVSTVAMMSPRCTRSPMAICQVSKVASVMSAPRAGR